MIHLHLSHRAAETQPMLWVTVMSPLQTPLTQPQWRQRYSSREHACPHPKLLLLPVLPVSQLTILSVSPACLSMAQKVGMCEKGLSCVFEVRLQVRQRLLGRESRDSCVPLCHRPQAGFAHAKAPAHKGSHSSLTVL